MDNMELWDSVCETNPKHTKKVKYGSREFTAIDAYPQIKQATQRWGPFGAEWGVNNEQFLFAIDNTILVYTAVLYVKPINVKMHIHASISTTMKGKLDGDCVKKVATDALTKGLSKLGWNYDVFSGRFDANKYVAEMNAKYSGKNPDKKAPGEIESNVEYITDDQKEQMFQKGHVLGMDQDSTKAMLNWYRIKHLKGIKATHISESDAKNIIDLFTDIHAEYMKDKEDVVI